MTETLSQNTQVASVLLNSSTPPNLFGFKIDSGYLVGKTITYVSFYTTAGFSDKNFTLYYYNSLTGITTDISSVENITDNTPINYEISFNSLSIPSINANDIFSITSTNFSGNLKTGTETLSTGSESTNISAPDGGSILYGGVLSTETAVE